MPWRTLDTSSLLADMRAMREATISGNVGAFPRPLGPVLRRPPYPSEETPDEEDIQYDGYTVPPQYRALYR